MKRTHLIVVLLVFASLAAIGCAKKEKYAGEWRDNCLNEIKQLNMAKEQWALEHKKTSKDVPSVSDITPYIKVGPDGGLPPCPAGGTYTLNEVGKSATCSIPSHAPHAP